MSHLLVREERVSVEVVRDSPIEASISVVEPKPLGAWLCGGGHGVTVRGQGHGQAFHFTWGG